MNKYSRYLRLASDNECAERIRSNNFNVPFMVLPEWQAYNDEKNYAKLTYSVFKYYKYDFANYMINNHIPQQKNIERDISIMIDYYNGKSSQAEIAKKYGLSSHMISQLASKFFRNFSRFLLRNKNLAFIYIDRNNHVSYE